MNWRFLGTLACTTLVALTLVGCDKSRTFSGTVTMDGAPLDAAGVQLISKTGGGRGVYYATTDAQGSYTIVEESTNPLDAGEYIVIVDKVPTEMGGKSVVADVYRDKAKTPLKMTVTDGSTSLPPIELSSKP